MPIEQLLILITTLTGAIVTIINAIKGHYRGTEARDAIETLHGQVNGRLTQLLESTRKSAHLEGYTAGRNAALGPDAAPET